MKQKLEIGSIVAFDELEFNYVIDRLNRNVVPYVNTMLDQFKSLGIDLKVDLTLLESITNTGQLTAVRDSYNSILHKKYEKFPSELLDVALSAINQKLAPIQKTVNEIQRGIALIRQSPLTRNYYFDVQDLLIINNVCSINEDNIKTKLQTVIESEEQIELVNEFLALEKAYNRVASLLEKTGEAISHTDAILNFFQMQEDNKLKYDASTLSYFKIRKQYAKVA